MSYSEMFDWNDKELTDIRWGEASESDDHIVPYPKATEDKSLVTFEDHNKNQWNQETGTAKRTESKRTTNDVLGCKLEGGSYFDTDEELSGPFDMDPWPDLPFPRAAGNKGYADRNDQDSMDTEISSDVTKMTNFDSAKAYTCYLDNPELFWSEHEDKENCGFPDYAWANIGSFDDLDRIFGNDDPIFGRESLNNVDELWSSSADVIDTPAQLFPLSARFPSSELGALRNTSDEQYEPKMEFGPYEDLSAKMEFGPYEDQSIAASFGKTNDPNSHDLQNVHQSERDVTGQVCCSNVKPVVDCAGANAKSTQKMKVSKRRTLLKEEKSKRKMSEDSCGTWSPTANQFGQLGNQFPATTIQTFQPSILSPKRNLGEPESFRYMTTPHPYLPAVNGNPMYHHPVMPLLSKIHSERNKHQAVPSGYEYSLRLSKHSNPSKKSSDVPPKSLAMTPQEKIEKLRRRQQMLAMIAIQKQQQQLSHHITSTDHSVTQKFPEENQSQDTVGTNAEVEENLKVPPFLDPSSQTEQDESIMNSMVIDECSLEETIHQLQDVIGKLDIRIHHCIRDSLLRLAESAMQRHNGGDSSSTNRSSGDENETIAKEETNSHSRAARMPDVETETNPIDRTVAHLLFHKPSESFTGLVKDEIPKSPVSTKLHCEPKTQDFMDLRMECLSESLTDKESVSHQGSKPPCTMVKTQHTDQF